MSETKLADLSVEDRTEYISDMCVLAQHIKDLTLKLQIKKGAVKQYMEEKVLIEYLLNVELYYIWHMTKIY